MSAEAWTVVILSLTKGVLTAKLSAGDAQADASANPPPTLHLCIGTAAVRHPVTLAQQEQGSFIIQATVPPIALSDGVIVLTLRDSATDIPLASYPIRAGGDVDRDLAADLALLRAEVAALKLAFLTEANTAKLRAVERPLIVAEAVENALAAVAEVQPQNTATSAAEPGIAEDATTDAQNLSGAGHGQVP